MKEVILKELQESWLQEFFSFSQQERDEILKNSTKTIEEMRLESHITGIWPIRKLRELTEFEKSLVAFIYKISIQCESIIKENSGGSEEVFLEDLDDNVCRKLLILQGKSDTLNYLGASFHMIEYPHLLTSLCATGVFEIKQVPVFSGNIYTLNSDSSSKPD